MRNLFLFAEFRKIAEALKARNVPVIVLKGMHLAAAVYGEIGMREMDDIDILVPRDQLQAAANALVEIGFVSKEPLDVEFWAQKQHHCAQTAQRNKYCCRGPLERDLARGFPGIVRSGGSVGSGPDVDHSWMRSASSVARGSPIAFVHSCLLPTYVLHGAPTSM